MRPGVPMMMCAPALNASSWSRYPTPPYTATERTPVARPSSSASVATFKASSRVGTRMRACVLLESGLTISSKGSKYAPVFPLPVRDWIIMSRWEKR